MNKQEMKKALKAIQTKNLTDRERSTLPGSFITLPSGNTHYEVQGDGKPTVLVHGYVTPYYNYDKISDAMVKAGYRVLRYDLLGRGFSERVNVRYDAELFAKQLDEISTAIFQDSPFYLVGTSMGGIVCTTFYRLHPEKVLKLALLAPAGMDTFRPPLNMRISNVKGLGYLAFNLIAGKFLLKKCGAELYYSTAEEMDYYQRNFAISMQYKGFYKATLSSLRNTVLRMDISMEGYRAVAKGNVPFLCIWGTADKTMPFFQHERLLEVCPNVQLLTYKDSGHLFLYDQGEQTGADIINFFGRD